MLCAIPSTTHDPSITTSRSRSVSSDSRIPEVREYVQNHRDDLAYILRHSQDETVRSLVLAVLLRGSDECDLELIKRELDRLAAEDSR